MSRAISEQIKQAFQEQKLHNKNYTLPWK